jgi:flagellar biosynthesis protein FlhA
MGLVATRSTNRKSSVYINDKESNEGQKIHFIDPLAIEIGYALVSLAEKEADINLLELIQNVRIKIAEDTGFVMPKVRINDNSILEPNEYCIKLNGVDMGHGKIFLDKGENGLIITKHLEEIVSINTADLLSLQSTKDILDAVRKENPALINELLNKKTRVRLVDIQQILRNLLKEKVSICNMFSILEAITYHSTTSKYIWYLTEKARQALASQICSQYADTDKKLHVLRVAPVMEQKIFDSIHHTPNSFVSVLEPEIRKSWIKAVAEATLRVRRKGWPPVILCSERARFLVKESTNIEIPDLAILSIPEITQDFFVEEVGVISIE